MSAHNYEFSEQENLVISKTALWAKVLGAVLLAEGALKLLQIADNPVGTVVSLVIAVIIGLAFINGGNGLSRVVKTEGDDVVHLMEGLTQLTRAFTVRIVIMVVALAFVGLGVLAVGCMVALN